jgi:hypothetical protein
MRSLTCVWQYGTHYLLSQHPLFHDVNCHFLYTDWPSSGSRSQCSVQHIYCNSLLRTWRTWRDYQMLDMMKGAGNLDERHAHAGMWPAFHPSLHPCDNINTYLPLFPLTLKMEAACTSETSATLPTSTQYKDPRAKSTSTSNHSEA